MAKKDTNDWIIVAAIILAVIILVKWENPLTINQNQVIEDARETHDAVADSTTSSSSTSDLCSGFTQNYPNYFMVKEILCHGVGGDYICEPRSVGCYGITAWDNAAGCASAQAQALKAFCSTQGGRWDCNAIQISCEKLNG